jgi:hypothetical protein
VEWLIGNADDKQLAKINLWQKIWCHESTCDKRPSGKKSTYVRRSGGINQVVAEDLVA